LVCSLLSGNVYERSTLKSMLLNIVTWQTQPWYHRRRRLVVHSAAFPRASVPETLSSRPTTTHPRRKTRCTPRRTTRSASSDPPEQPSRSRGARDSRGSGESPPLLPPATPPGVTLKEKIRKVSNLSEESRYRREFELVQSLFFFFFFSLGFVSFWECLWVKNDVEAHAHRMDM